MPIRASAHFGIVIRKDALRIKGVPREHILRLVEATEPLDEDDALLSLGPHFGQEASDEMVRRLRAIGLEFWDDFFEVHVDLPEWIEVRVAIAGVHRQGSGRSQEPGPD